MSPTRPSRALIRAFAVATCAAVASIGAHASADATTSVTQPTAVASTPAAAHTADDDAKRVGFGAVPATPTDIDQRAFFSYGLGPGTSVFDHVALVNYGDKPLPLSLAVADALNSNEGGFALQPTGDRPLDLGKWITVGTPRQGKATIDAQGRVTVPGRGSSGAPGRVILPVTIAVPKDAAPGDHAAGIIAVLTTESKNPKGQNVKLEQRVAARVYVKVAGAIKPELSVARFDVSYSGGALPWQSGTTTVIYEVVNSGNVRLGFDPALRVGGPFGLGVQTIDLDPIAELLPHNSQTFTKTVDGVWPLIRGQALLSLTPQAAVAAPLPDLGQLTETRGFWTLTWWVVIALMLVLGGVTWRLAKRVGWTLPSRGDRSRATRLKAVKKQSTVDAPREKAGV